MSDKAKLEYAGQTLELPVIEGSEGEKAIDISKLRGSLKLITLDNGFVNTGSCLSGVTFLDGEKGILRYRGYPIEQLAQKGDFLDTSWLLFHGKLATQDELQRLSSLVSEYSKLPAGVEAMIDQFPKNAHPMGVITSAVAALSGFYPDLLDQDPTDDQKNRLFAQLLGQTKAIAARFYRRSQGLEPVASRPDLSYAADFLYMMFGQEPDKDVAEALDVLLILHADHEQNCSASTVRVVGSSKANLFASISAGVSALWGPLHGGANQAVLEMLEAIEKDGGGHKKFLEKAKDKEDNFRLMGFGHRVYKNFDPRARIIKTACDTILTKLGVQDPLLDIAKGLEEEALNDPYFVDRKLYPNVDFYSGIIYRALGIPTNLFTGMFVLGRMPGWISQWKEMTEDSAVKICRPRQIYTGANERDFTEVKKR